MCRYGKRYTNTISSRLATIEVKRSKAAHGAQHMMIEIGICQPGWSAQNECAWVITTQKQTATLLNTTHAKLLTGCAPF